MKMIRGDLLDPANFENSLIVHGCNARGVMGSGVAKAVRATFPKCYEEYHEAFIENRLVLGGMVLYQDDVVRIGNCITQNSTGSGLQVSYDAIYHSLSKAFVYAVNNGLTLKMPMIGAGLGGGDWYIIKAIIISLETKFETEAEVYYLG